MGDRLGREGRGPENAKNGVEIEGGGSSACKVAVGDSGEVSGVLPLESVVEVGEDLESPEAVVRGAEERVEEPPLTEAVEREQSLAEEEDDG